MSRPKEKRCEYISKNLTSIELVIKAMLAIRAVLGSNKGLNLRQLFGIMAIAYIFALKILDMTMLGSLNERKAWN